jgi:membrane peptidoglycan carboxypeptidase
LILRVALGLAVLTGLVVAWCLYEIFLTPPGELARDEIVKRVSRESPVLYADGQRQVGAFFTGAHRKYVPLEEIPKTVLDAIVAAEDQNFRHHFGIDPLATAKAFVEGVGHLHLRRAGSTITQQTVKIVFDDWENSLRRKAKEALAAAKMERLYTKDQILEFYLNQFHVTSNGHGIGVAARYYFDKDVKDLDLVEAAFIAGAVKHPTKYNPFTKYSDAEREAAAAAAKERKDYVIRRMLEDGYIDAAQAAAARARPVPFKRGEFRSGDVTLVDLVRSQLDQKEILDAAGLEDAEDFNRAGLRIVTTLDYDIQSAAEDAVRRNLTRLEVLLKGYAPEPEDRYRALRDLTPGDYAYGRVVEVEKGPEPAVVVSFGAPTGRIEASSLRDVAGLLARASGQSEASHLKSLLAQLKPGAVVFTRVETYDDQSRHAALSLARRPTVNGGLIVVDAGEVRASVPGFDQQGYDRTFHAQRQPGSMFKAIVFHAALQLGWSILDPLNNARRIFPYRGKLYAPRGDHVSEFDEVSMLWAGIESENIASVWLTAHLLDKVSMTEFKTVLAELGLAPLSGESEEAYAQRLGRTLNVKITDDGIDERQLDLVTAEMVPDTTFAREPLASKRLRTIWYGRDYERELARATTGKAHGMAAAERDARAALIANNFRRLSALGVQARNDWINLTAAVKKYGAATALQQPSLRVLVQRFALVPGPDRTDLAYLGDAAAHSAIADVVTRPLAASDIDDIFGGGLKSMLGFGTQVDDVRLDGWLTLARLDEMSTRVTQRAAAAKAVPGDMGLGRLYQHHDFRIAVALRYLVRFTQALGATSKIEPVLSFALGTNVLTLAEDAKIYQTLLDGHTHRFYEDGPPNQLNLIKRIESPSGETLYVAKDVSERIVSPEPSRALLEILRRVVTHGTGSLLHRELVIETGKGVKLRVPAFGKTGTTNDFTSGSFAGFLPRPAAKGRRLDPLSSYVIAAYAGFDRNEPMRHGRFRGYGSDVALPAWLDVAKAIVRTPAYADDLDALDLDALGSGELPLVGDGSDTASRVDLIHGGNAGEAAANDTATVQVPRRLVRLFKGEKPASGAGDAGG